MLQLTDCIDTVARDIVNRVPALAHVDMDRVLVFARAGRGGAHGPIAACHCLGLPPTEPGYYFWKSASGVLLRRTPYFVQRQPSVVIHGRPIGHLLSFSLPRFCNQSLERQSKRRFYDRAEPWLARLDTIVHELYHIDPAGPGIRLVDHGAGRTSIHGESFLRQVAELVERYLAAGPPPALLEWLQHDFAALQRIHGGVAATVFRSFPSYPMPVPQTIAFQPVEPEVPVVPMTTSRRPACFDERDLDVRVFEADGRTCRAAGRGFRHRDAPAVAA